jgi:hypothetical protein
MCFLPADAELNARTDIKPYLTVLTTNNPADIATAAAATYNFLACNPPACPLRRTCPPPTCRSIRYGPAAARPFTLLTTTPATSVNMCGRTLPAGVTREGCPAAGNNNQANFDNAVATTWFRMSKWYTTGSWIFTVNAGANFGVGPQPCQVSPWDRGCYLGCCQPLGDVGSKP